MQLVAPTFHQRIRGFLVGVAQRIEGLATVDPATGESVDEAEGVVDDAYRVADKLVTGEATETEDFAALADIVETVGDQAVMDGEPDDGPATDQPLAADIQDLLGAHVGRFLSPTPWAKDTSPDKLASAVQLAAHLVDMMNTLAPALASTEDERRAEIAVLAGRFTGPLLDIVPEVTEGSYSGAEVLPVLGKLVLPSESAGTADDSNVGS